MDQDQMIDEPGYDESWPIIAQAEDLRIAFQAVKYWHEAEQHHRLQSARVNLKARLAELLREAKVTGLTFGTDGTFIQWLNDEEGAWTLATLQNTDGDGQISYHLQESEPIHLRLIEEKDDGEDTATEPNSL